MTEDKYRNSRRLLWFNNIAIVAVTFVSLFILKEAAVPVLAIAIPSMAGLTGYWSKVVNPNVPGD